LGTASNPNNKKREWAAAAGRLSTVSCTHYWRNKADVSTHSVWRKSLVCSGAGGHLIGCWRPFFSLYSRQCDPCVCVHVRPRSWPKTTRRICGFRAHFFQLFFFFRGRERERERERESNRA
jgi:hypothetical protein